ncbi:hypothetical protein BJS_09015 [Bradyrhizobium japonicum SEMIA 5079]|nr:hypothetical protein BJS_09015 [Bradyrhizobium japonicum SEMIA 5079]
MVLRSQRFHRIPAAAEARPSVAASSVFLTDGISARAEYRVTHLGARDDLASDFMTSLSAGGMVHTLRGVLAYHLPTP